MNILMTTKERESRGKRKKSWGEAGGGVEIGGKDYQFGNIIM